MLFSPAAVATAAVSQSAGVARELRWDASPVAPADKDAAAGAEEDEDLRLALELQRQEDAGLVGFEMDASAFGIEDTDDESAMLALRLQQEEELQYMRRQMYTSAPVVPPLAMAAGDQDSDELADDDDESPRLTYEDLVQLSPVRRGLAFRKVWAMPTMRFARASHNLDHAACSICLEEYVDGDSLRILMCQHHFHTACVDEWLRGSQVCPTCRMDQNGADPAP